MKAAISLLLAVTLASTACGSTPPAEATGPEFPALTGRIVDEADLLPPAQERQLAAESAALEREVGPQYVIVTLPSLQGYPILEYGVGLGREWGIGSGERNDGIILLVAANERQVRIEVGRGLERRVTDPYAARVLEEQIMPRFREGDMAGGIVAGSQALIARLRSRQSEAEIARADGVIT
jgi:uncharacterized protein